MGAVYHEARETSNLTGGLFGLSLTHSFTIGDDSCYHFAIATISEWHKHLLIRRFTKMEIALEGRNRMGGSGSNAASSNGCFPKNRKPAKAKQAEADEEELIPDPDWFPAVAFIPADEWPGNAALTRTRKFRDMMMRDTRWGKGCDETVRTAIVEAMAIGTADRIREIDAWRRHVDDYCARSSTHRRALFRKIVGNLNDLNGRLNMVEAHMRSFIKDLSARVDGLEARIEQARTILSSRGRERAPSAEASVAMAQVVAARARSSDPQRDLDNIVAEYASRRSHSQEDRDRPSSRVSRLHAANVSANDPDISPLVIPERLPSMEKYPDYVLRSPTPEL